MRSVIAGLMVLSVLAVGCGDDNETIDASMPGDLGDDQSVSIDLSMQMVDGFASCVAGTCPLPFSCKHDTCVPDLGTCTTGEQCPGDSYCDADHTCVPFGVPPSVVQDPLCNTGDDSLITVELTNLAEICQMHGMVTLTAKICDRGNTSAMVPAIVIFRGTPVVDAGGDVHLCNASIPSTTLDVGTCVTASCTAEIDEDMDIHASIIMGGTIGTSCYMNHNRSAGSFQLCPPVL